MGKISPGSIVIGTSGIPLTVLAIEPDYLLLEKPDGTTAKARHSAIVRVLSQPPTPTPSPTAIQIGDRLRRLPTKRTTYPAGWFGKDAAGKPLADMRPSVSELVATVTGFAPDGYKVRTIDGRNFRVSHEAIELGEWMRVLGQNN
jgi:hypothetical protein